MGWGVGRGAGRTKRSRQRGRRRVLRGRRRGPVGLSETMASVALAGGKGAGVSVGIAKGAMQMIAWVKAKFAAGVAACVLVAGGAGTLAVHAVNARGGARPAFVEVKAPAIE